MEIAHPRCCGLDVHKKTVVACTLVTGADGAVQREVRSFSTTTDELLQLADWLALRGVSHVAMESTGVCWKPLYNLLEGSFTLLLVDAQHIKAVPGRKTDVKDAEWVADLLRHGLLRASFVPDQGQRELRELTRYRTALVRERATEVNRLQKVLGGANVKLGAVASDVLGVSGRQMLEGLIAGRADPTTLAQLAHGKLREKIPLLERALAGRFGAHQRFLVAEQLAHIDYLDEMVARLSAEVAERLRPFAALIEWLDEIPGVNRRAAAIILAETGADMGRFPSAAHLASWAGVAPGSDESAGKRRGGRARKGAPWLRAVRVEAGHAAGRAKDSYLGAQYRRLAARRGKKRAAMAVGHSILVITYHMLTRGCAYEDLGPQYFDAQNPEKIKERLVRRLERLGYRVEVKPAAQAARSDHCRQHTTCSIVR
jgi:transposase